MIIEHDGKRLAFGMNWKSRLSEGDVHGDARAAKSKYFWYADKAVYFGVLPEEEVKKKQKSPLYAGAVALLHNYPDVPNLVMVLAVPKGNAELPDGGYIVCGIHQSRPRSGYDKVVRTEVEVSEMLMAFKVLCGIPGFGLYGDAKISGIVPATMGDVSKGADQTALMRKTKSAMVNPLLLLAVGSVVVGASGYAYHAYTQYKKVKAQRLTMAAHKNSQQLYNEELSARRLDATVLAQNVPAVLAPLREMTYSLGGWALSKATCKLPPDKNMACTFEYLRRPGSKATYETFVAVAKGFENVEFAGETIKAAKKFKTVPFTEQGKAIDSAKTQRDEIIEFGSDLQRLDSLGKPKREEFQAYAMPRGANVGELTTPPVMTAGWEFTTPFRNVKQLATFPSYATISQLVVTYNDKPVYEPGSSLAMVTVTGKIFSKSN
jgi:hypothetical protein